MIKDKLINKYKRIKRLKLLASIMIDLTGILSFLLPVIWESGDFLWAPISGLMIFLLYPNRKKFAIGGMIEEMLPFTDIIPTACLTWRVEYVTNQDETLSNFIRSEVTEEMTISRAVDELHFSDLSNSPIIDI